MQGDLVLKLNGRDVSDVEEFFRYVGTQKVGDNLTLKINRNGIEQVVTATLTNRIETRTNWRYDGYPPACLSNNGKLLVIAGIRGTAICEVTSGDVFLELPQTPRHEYRRFAFSPNDRYLAAAAYWGVLRGNEKEPPSVVEIWDLRDKRIVATLRGHGDLITNVAYSKDGRRVITSSRDRTIRVWDASHFSSDEGERAKVRRFFLGLDEFDDEEVLDGKAGRGGKGTRRATPIDARELQLYHLRTLKGHRGSVDDMAIHPHGAVLASVGDDSIRIWDITQEADPILLPNVSTVGQTFFHPDGRRLVTTETDRGENGQVILWDTTTKQRTQLTKTPVARFSSIDMAPDGSLLAFFGNKDTKLGLTGACEIWDLTTERLIHSVQDPAVLHSLAFHPKKRFFLRSTGQDHKPGTLWGFDIDSEKQTNLGSPHKSGVSRIAYISDGNRYATAGYDGFVRIWDSHSNDKISEFAAKAAVHNICFNKDESLLAAAVGNNTLVIWDVASGKEIQTLRGHREFWGRIGLFFSPDGRRLFSVLGEDFDSELRVWDTSTWLEVFAYKDRVRYRCPLRAALSPDGHRMAMTSLAGIKIFDARPR
jgi:WD40 repeat protein